MTKPLSQEGLQSHALPCHATPSHALPCGALYPQVGMGYCSMIIFAWILSLALVGALGYYLRDTREMVSRIQSQLAGLKNPPVVEEPKSVVIDELSAAKAEYEERMRRLNP